MTEEHLVVASLPTLRRLPRYAHVLKKLKKQNVEHVSATLIARELGIEPIQVRKDLSVTKIVGKPKIGFNLDELLTEIGNYLNWNNKEDAVLVGVGALGEAIIGYENFKNYGLNIIAVFDNNEKKIGENIHGFKIQSISELHKLVKRRHVNIAIITTPGEVAQEYCDNLVKVGIKAIWNFSPTSLKVSDNVVIESVHLSQSLAILTHKLARKLEEK